MYKKGSKLCTKYNSTLKEKLWKYDVNKLFYSLCSHYGNVMQIWFINYSKYSYYYGKNSYHYSKYLHIEELQSGLKLEYG